MTEYEIVSSAFLASPASLLASAIFDPWPGLIISVYIPGYALTGTAVVQFNGDTGANYSYAVSDLLAVATSLFGQTGFPVSQTANLAISQWVMNIQNVPSQTKGCFWQGTGGLLSSVAPIILLGSGIWGNNSAPITQVQLNSGAVNMNAGTRIAVIGISP
jgi:hypothetical protein